MRLSLSARRSLGTRVRGALAGIVLTLVILPASAAAATSAWVIHPFAGDGVSGTAQPGPATQSPLEPGLIAFDPSGDLYIVDRANPQIDKVSPQGTLSVFAGDGTAAPPTLGDQASATSLQSPSAVTADDSGDVYIADSATDEVYKVDPAGVITLFAGNGGSGTTVAGTATSVPLDDPDSMTTDAAGDVYIATYYTRQVVKVTPAGQLTLVAGDGVSGTPTLGQTATSQPLGKPGEMAVDTAGDLLLADYSNSQIYSITPAGIINAIAGDQTTGTPTSGQPALSQPEYRAVGLVVRPDGLIDLASQGDNALYEIDPAGNISVLNPVSGGVAPTYGDPLSESDLDEPGYLAMSPAGALYVVDSGSNTIDELIPPEPADVQVPVISGTPTVGQTLTATLGQWTGDDIDYRYQWQLCNASGTSCVSIAGATSSTYTTTSDEVGSTLRVVVTAENAGGSASATSNATTVIASVAAPTTTTTTPPTTSTTTPTTTTPTPTTTTQTPANPTTTSGEGVNLSGKAASSGVSVSGTGAVLLPLVCPQTATGCDASGLLTLSLSGPAPRAVIADATAPVKGGVLARFAGLQIQSGQTRLASVKLTPAATRYLQSRGVHRVRVTLTIHNHLSGGPVVTTSRRVWLNIASLQASCPAATGTLTASSVGQMKLNLTRAQAERLGRYRLAHYGFERYCLTGGVIRVAFTTKRLLHLNGHVSDVHVGRTDLALTGNHHYSVRGLQTGMAISKARSRLHLGRGITIGKNTWYFAPEGHGTTVLKAQSGRIREIGVAIQTLTRTRAQQILLLRNL